MDILHVHVRVKQCAEQRNAKKTSGIFLDGGFGQDVGFKAFLES